MRLWRLSAHTSFDGEGARRFGGRWNFPGTTVIYTSATLALAALEFLVHIDRDTAPPDLVAYYADMPDDLEVRHISASGLPPNWREHPPPDELRRLGSTWVAERGSLALSVPTAVFGVPIHLLQAERNYLLNPAHPDFGRLDVGHERFRLDPRLWRFG